MDWLNIATNVLLEEAKALNESSTKLDQVCLEEICSLFGQLRNNDGSLVFCGVGKSGLIGQKLASTFCSLGLSSYMLHPVEALHGDLGRLKEKDVLVLISKSGTTEEIIKLLPFLSVPKKRRIGLLGNIDSSLGHECGTLIDCSVTNEVCLNNQAPTTSAVVTLAMGHMMAVLFQHTIGLSREKFAVNHPGGILGKSLRMKVKHLMTPLKDCPILNEKKTLQDAILEMGRIPLGGLGVLNLENEFRGIIVEGDIRRAFVKFGKDALGMALENIMNSNPVNVAPNELAYTALELMENRKNQIGILPVIENNRLFGFIRLHDLLREGFFLEKMNSSSIVSP